MKRCELVEVSAFGCGRGMAAVAALALTGLVHADCLKVASPDGRNEIRLHDQNLSYEVLRDGVVVVAKSRIGLTIDGRDLAKDARARFGEVVSFSGKEAAPIYKKAEIDLSRREGFADFGDWGVRLVARDDGVAYRFETKRAGTLRVDAERADLAIPDGKARCWANKTLAYGCEETVPVSSTAAAFKSGYGEAVYLPFAYSVGGKCVAVTESDVRDYPILNFVTAEPAADGVVRLVSSQQRAAKRTGRDGLHIRILEHEDYLVKTSGARTFPWRTFVLADAPVKFCESDIVRALAPAPDRGADFSWVRPGMVAWDWWNCFDNADRKTEPNGGCTTKTYRRFIDFAQKNGVRYVIFDAGWSKGLDIWTFHPEVDVPSLVRYAKERDVGIILWMAWPEAYGKEEKVAEHFSKLGAKGFKVDFLDRGDAEMANFMERFAAACAKHRMVVDYHGVYRPTGLQRRYPNVLNYEGIHGLETAKWHKEGEDAAMMFSDVAAFYLRLTAGPMDYTPGAMLNHAVGSGYRGGGRYPGSVGTRCRQMAMMALYEAPLQMLCDSPTHYERNMECFSFMAGTPVVWAETVGLDGTPDTMVAAARRAKDGRWYAAGLTTAEARDFTLDTAFLGAGRWKAEIFRDGPDADRRGDSYVRESRCVKAGEKLGFHMAPGGGFVVKFAATAE